jgi:DNA polymerase III sliding clamp (beta) subunit (PCNA family)
MKIKRFELSQALSCLTKLVEKRPYGNLQALACVKFEHFGYDGARLTGTDLDAWLQIDLDTDNVFPTFVVNVHDLAKIVKCTKSDKTSVDFIVNDNLTITVHFSGGSATLPTFQDCDFPQQPNSTSIVAASWTSERLVDGLGYCNPVISTDITRNAAIRGLAWYVDDTGLRLAASDGHRLHTYRMPLPIADMTSFIVPRKSSFVLANICKVYGGSTTVFLGDLHSVFGVNGTATLYTKTVDGTFPPIDQVIPSYEKCETYYVECKELSTVLKSMCADNLKLSCNGQIVVSAATPDGQITTREYAPMHAPNHADLFHIGFNRPYLIEAMGGCESVKMAFHGPLDPLVVTADTRLAVIMPMRI